MESRLETNRFLLKSLSPAQDSFENYLSWMRNDKSNPFIQGVNVDLSKQDLVDYVSEKNISETALLLGIFLIPSNTHIGNIKLEPILPLKSATIGILIGEESWRGKGVGFEVISRVLEFCFIDLELEFVELGVNRNNLRAINLYTRLGFIECDQEPYSSESIRMSISKSRL
jgi:ribosomal-protein-alanine N-acetyltransferase